MLLSGNMRDISLGNSLGFNISSLHLIFLSLFELDVHLALGSLSFHFFFRGN